MQGAYSSEFLGRWLLIPGRLAGFTLPKLFHFRLGKDDGCDGDVLESISWAHKTPLDRGVHLDERLGLRVYLSRAKMSLDVLF